MTDKKYLVRWNKGKAHLSDDGQKTFCGCSIKNWAVDEPATLSEYIKTVRPRCSGCRLGAEVALAFGELDEEEA